MKRLHPEAPMEFRWLTNRYRWVSDVAPARIKLTSIRIRMEWKIYEVRMMDTWANHNYILVYSIKNKKKTQKKNHSKRTDRLFASGLTGDE